MTDDVQMDANNMSDHEALIDEKGNIISQNLQGPYAIKLTGNPPKYSFDLPFTVSKGYLRNDDPKNSTVAPPKTSVEKIVAAAKNIAAVTSLDESQAKTLIQLIIKDDETAIKSLLTTINKSGVGDRIGFSRFSLESHADYNARMQKQIASLSKNAPKIICTQEQPYTDDRARTPIFNKIMKDAGYVSAATLDQRDVGIWVKQDTQDSKHSISSPSQKFGDDIAKPPYRACAAVVDGCLVVNTHFQIVTGKSADKQIESLKKFRDICRQEAQSLGVELAITGDMNLYKLTQAQAKQVKSLGFDIELVKGQEKHILDKTTNKVDPNKTANYEAFIKARPVPALTSHQKMNAVLSQTPSSTPNKTTAPSANTVKGSGLSQQISEVHQNLQKMGYQNLVTSLDAPDQFDSNHDFQYRMEFPSTTPNTSSGIDIKGQIKNDGSGDILASGDWNDDQAEALAKHIIHDLKWDTVDLKTTGKNAIPEEYVDKIISKMQQEARGQQLNISIDGKAINQPSHSSDPVTPSTQTSPSDDDEITNEQQSQMKYT